MNEVDVGEEADIEEVAVGGPDLLEPVVAHQGGREERVGRPVLDPAEALRYE